MLMTKAMGKVFEYLPEILDSKTVCPACRDKLRCSECEFYSHNRIQAENERS